MFRECIIAHIQFSNHFTTKKYADKFENGTHAALNSTDRCQTNCTVKVGKH